MKFDNYPTPIDWRERLLSLPSGTEPPSSLFTLLLRSLLCLGLFAAGALFVLFSGALVGLSRGIGPEQTGGALYVLAGLIANLLAGAGIAALVSRCSVSRVTARLVFYAFTTPALLAVLFMAFTFAKSRF